VKSPVKFSRPAW